MTESRDPYPVHVDASPDPLASRGLWLIKWLLLIPHFVVLMFLWVAFAVVSVVAFTARYPKSLYVLVMGIDRWSLRVAAYAGLMTDAYPPFRLDQGGTDPGSAPAGPAPTALAG